MNSRMWRVVEVVGTALVVCDTILLAACWLLMQFVLAMVARGIWRTTPGWHGVVGAATFALFTTILWALAVWSMRHARLRDDL
ncbi:MAG: hypothetical protein Q7R85_02695 [bacterium]|nr:hypothetical protein [bacterium]